MRTILRWLRNIVILLVLVLAGLWFFGPREPIDPTITFDAARIGDDLDAYLTQAEAQFADITPGTQKRIVWAGEAGEKTDVAVIYVHGYSATSEEIRPVPDQVAKALGANLFFTRLAGHGRGALPMSEPSMNTWMQDLAEAMEVGRRLGDKVLLITTSTGGTLAMAGAAQDATRAGMAGIVLISPNFGPRDPMAELANWPLARQWVPAVAGDMREWEPHNDQQGTYWTTRYETVAALPMMALVKHARDLDKSALDVPTLWIYSDSDQVVDPARTATAFDAYGGPKDRVIRTVGPDDDPSAHVIAGDILSPNQTAETVQIITDWANGL